MTRAKAEDEAAAGELDDKTVEKELHLEVAMLQDLELRMRSNDPAAWSKARKLYENRVKHDVFDALLLSGKRDNWSTSTFFFVLGLFVSWLLR
ncbi:MAG: hypothetical protein LC808_14165 [Actinobacteria bacterium]|nr:hypothetical protein [Actinomycetota bacterium]